MATHLPFLCKTCITNITIERLFLHELILVQEGDEKFEPLDDKNAIKVKFLVINVPLLHVGSTLKTFCFDEN